MKNFFKQFNSLTFQDDFMFCKVLTDDPILCKKVIEVCIGRKIGNIVYSDPQKSIKATSDGRGVRLDVYTEDDENRAFDLEMESSFRKEKMDVYPERTRFYLGMMDKRNLKSGENFSMLKDNYVIFFLPFNLFPKLNYHKYTFKALCVENPKAELKDRNTRIFLCTEGDSNESDELLALLKYIETGIPVDELTSEIDSAIRKAAARGEWEDEYMELWEKYNDIREISLKEGHAEGLKEGREDVIKEMINEGILSMEQGAEKIGISVEEMRDRMNR